MDISHIYIIGVFIAAFILYYELDKRDLAVVVGSDRILLLSLLSWIVVGTWILSLIRQFLVYAFVIIVLFIDKAKSKKKRI